MKWLGLLLVLFGIGIGAWVVDDNYNRSFAEIDVFHRVWNEDLAHLEASKKFPPGWYHLRMVEYTALDRDSWTWIENRKPNISIDPEGGFKLEVLVDQWDDEEGKAALVEYHLIELSTENKVWELGRTFTIRDLKR